MFTMTKPLQFFIALMIGSLATAIVFFILKKPTAFHQEKTESEEEELDINMDSIKLS